MEKFKIKLFEPFRIDGKARPKGWEGITTSGSAKLVTRAGAGTATKIVPEKKPAKKKPAK